jgi:hypothetical protein
MTKSRNIHVKDFCFAEIVSLALTPFPITLSKSTLTDAGNAIGVPKGSKEIHPLLVTVFAHG